jgi:hypothetical protein
VHFVSGLLATDRRGRGTRGRRRALGCYRQPVLVLRWFLDGTRLAQLAADNAIGRSTAYRYLHEGIDALAAVAPGLRGALLAARAAGHTHLTVDGTLIRTNRCRAPGPTAPRPARPAGGPVVIGQVRGPRRQRAGRRRPGRLAAVDLSRAARPRARHHRAAHARRGAAAAGRVNRPDPRRPGRSGVRGRAGGAGHADHKDHRRAADRRSAHRRPAARGHPGPGRTRQLAAQDHLQGAAPGQPLPLAHRRNHRRRFGPAPPSARPHHMINIQTQPLLGTAHCPST